MIESVYHHDKNEAELPAIILPWPMQYLDVVIIIRRMYRVWGQLEVVGLIIYLERGLPGPVCFSEPSPPGAGLVMRHCRYAN